VPKFVDMLQHVPVFTSYALISR